MKHYGDITKLKGYMLPEVDVVTGGSPCQDLSVAGKRAGLDGARSGLFMEQIRVIKEMRENDQLINGTEGADIKPRFMVWENVPGAFSSNKGEDFRAVLEETAKVCDETTTIPEPHKGKWHNSGAIMGDGWSIAWRVFDAQFWGVPQRRRRIYLVADFGGQSAPEVLFKRDGLPGYTAQSGVQGQGTATDTQDSTGEASGFDGYNGDLTGDVSSTLGVNCGMSTGRNGVMAGISYGVVSKGNGDAFLSEERHTSLSQGGGQAGQGYPCVLEPIAVATQQGGAEISDNGICPTVTAAAGMSGNNQPWICSKPTISIEMGALERDQGNRMWEEVAPTMRAAVNDNSPCHILEPFVKSRRAKFQGDFETWVEGKVNPTLNNFDLGDIRTTTAVVEKDVFEWHNQDSRVTGPIDTACTLNTNAGGREGHLVMDAPITLQIRSGKEGGGKGPLTQEDLSATLTAGNTQYLFEPEFGNPNQKAYGMSSYASNAMKSSNPHSGVYEAETSRTLDLNGGNPACNQGGIMIVDDGTAQTLVSRGPGAVFALDRASFNQGANAQYNFSIEDDGTAQTLVSRGPGAVADVPTYSSSKASFFTLAEKELANTLVATDYKDPPCINVGNTQTVRRLTPLECERLQGFPDGWTDISNLPEDLEFWRGVWDTYAEINGTKPKTDKAILTWLKNPTSDSAQYKALGNSVALPNVYYVLYGIAEQLGFKGTIGSLFDGIGGFPICWEAICGKGTALWASEIEPFPIAVTKHHFTEEE